jgi:drug/metabolite transporter (DMT)-like permease
MLYVFLLIVATTSTAQNIFTQFFNGRCKGSANLYSAMVSFTAMCVFILTTSDFSYSLELLLPSAAYAVTYACAATFSVLAFMTGPLSKTSLILFCSLLIPTAYGIIYQDIYLQGNSLSQALSPTLLLGILTLVITLVLINQKSGEEKDKKISLKWLIFVILGFLGNGLASTVQAFKQNYYGNESNGMFMVIAQLLVVLILVSCTFFIKSERKIAKTTVKMGWLPAIFGGICNGTTNSLIILLNKNSFPAAIMFPVISAGGLLLAFLWSVLVKKEKFTPIQYIGYGMGIVSLILLNLPR